jgi:hypothetical protein
MRHFGYLIYPGITLGVIAYSLMRTRKRDRGLDANALFGAVLAGVFWPLLLGLGALFAVIWVLFFPAMLIARLRTGSWDVTIRLRH